MLRMSSHVRLMSRGLIIFILSEPFQPPIHPNGSQWRRNRNSSSWLKAFGKGPCKNPSPRSPRRAQIRLRSLSTAPRMARRQHCPRRRSPRRVSGPAQGCSQHPAPAFPSPRLTPWAFQVNLLPPREGKYLIMAIIKSSGK